jgi:hypothetical protein
MAGVIINNDRIIGVLKLLNTASLETRITESKDEKRSVRV